MLDERAGLAEGEVEAAEPRAALPQKQLEGIEAFKPADLVKLVDAAVRRDDRAADRDGDRLSGAGGRREIDAQHQHPFEPGLPSGHFPDARLLALSAVGKSAATGTLTLPVAAHSAPRWRVLMKPTHSME